jgi:GNAT superfamily N-acetyltransferase
MSEKNNIRFVVQEDIHEVVDLCEAHAQYEQDEYSVKNKAEQLSKALFSTNPRLYCLVVEQNKELIGYATYTLQYSTWEACDYVYMGCLYMKEEARGFGIGEQLVRKIEEEGRKFGCCLIQWQTPDFNVRAIKFYKRIGAKSKIKERFFLEI